MATLQEKQLMLSMGLCITVVKPYKNKIQRDLCPIVVVCEFNSTQWKDTPIPMGQIIILQNEHSNPVDGVDIFNRLNEANYTIS